MAKEKKSVSNFSKGPIGWLERYSLFSYRHPFKLFFGILVVVIFLSIVGVLFGFELYNDGGEWDIKDDEQTERSAAISDALDELGSQVVQQTRSIEEYPLNLFLFYKAVDSSKNIYTKNNLEDIREFENTILKFDEYENYCLLNYTGSDNGESDCSEPISFLQYFFTYNHADHSYGDWIIPGDAEESIENGLKAMNDSYYQTRFFFDRGYNYEEGISTYSRSKYYYGLPLPGYESSKIDEDDQFEDFYDEHMKKLEDNLIEVLGKKEPFPELFRSVYQDVGKINNTEVVFYNFMVENEEFLNVVNKDFIWAFLSIFSVWVYMLIHTQSVFLSLVGIVEVFLSFPVALFFYSIVFQIEYFSQMQLLVVFILLGIGADDVFIFTDAFKQSAGVPNVGRSLQERLMYTVSRATKAVFVTSFTTASAFFITATSPLMPMQAFGIFAGLCIVFLFFINLFLMPATLVIWAGFTHKLTNIICPCCINLKNVIPCCCCCHVEADETFFLPYNPSDNDEKSQSKQTNEVATKPPIANTLSSRLEQEMVSIDLNTANADANQSLPTDTPKQPHHLSEGVCSETPKRESSKNLRHMFSLSDGGIAKMRKMEKFFHGPYYHFIKRSKWFIIVIGLALTATGIFYATQFKVPDETEQWWPNEHDFKKYLDYIDSKKTPYASSSEDELTVVYIAYGLKGMDTDDRDIWVGDDYGKLVYDDTFDIYSAKAQEHLLYVCASVRDEKCSASKCTDKYLVTVDRESDTSYEEQQPCWLEDMRSWIKETYSDRHPNGLPIDDREEFHELLIEYKNSTRAQISFSEDIGLDKDGNLLFIIFRFDSTLKPPVSAEDIKDVIDEWERFMDMMNDKAVKNNTMGVSKGFQSGREYWTWPASSDALVQGAIQGLILVFVIAFIVLNIATNNLIISILAVMTLISIVAVVVGIGMKGIMDWDLGIAESITIVILIGFSMDYSLHLADSYIESPQYSREDRTRDSLTHIGISVTAGAFTTLVSGIFLWFTVLMFFIKFAFNITATILTSYLFSILYFTSLCMAFGPQGEFSNWTTFFSYCGLCKNY